MLMQNLKTPADLRLTDAEHRGFITVLGMLERGEIPAAEPGPAIPFISAGSVKPTGFSMHKFYAESADHCGAVFCMCGWVEHVGALEIGSLMLKRLGRDDLHRLFEPWDEIDFDSASQITPAQAAIALRNFLTFGEPRWAEAVQR